MDACAVCSYKARRDWQNTREVLGEARRVAEEIENAPVCCVAVTKHAGIGRTREKCEEKHDA